MMKCKKCQSESLVMRPNAKNPSATELVCGDCGAWQKFISKDEVRLFELRSSQKKLTNADRIRSMSDEELARHMLFFLPSCLPSDMHYTGLAGGYYATAQEAIQASLDWLRQPAKKEVADNE